MSFPYWPGEVIQTLSINGDQLSINPGNTVTLPGGGGGGQDWSQFPATQDVNMGNNGLSNVNNIQSDANFNIQALGDIVLSPSSGTTYVNGDLQVSSINGQPPITQTVSTFNDLTTSSLNADTITASTLTVNTLISNSTITSLSTISSLTFEAETATVGNLNASSINGQQISSLGNPADWSLYPAQSTINMAGNSLGYVFDPASQAYDVWATNQIGSVKYDTELRATMVIDTIPSTALVAYTVYEGADNHNVKASLNASSLTYSVEMTKTSSSTEYFIASMSANEAIGGWQFTDKANNNYLMSDGVLVAPSVSTNSLLISSINGSEFNQNGIVISTVNTDALQTNSLSSLVSYVGQQLVSTITFNPAVNISPQFNVDLNMGGFLTALGTGLFGVAVGVPVTAGTITYGLVKGLASLFEPRPINNINSNVFETFNYASQLQISTLGEQISTIYRFISTVPSTIEINDQPTFSTVSETNVEYFVSTLSQSSNPVCVRAIADPVQLVSTPWTVYQGFGEWVEIPELGNPDVPSTISLSTLSFTPSTLLKGDLDGAVLEVLESANGTDYGEVKSAGYWVTLSNTDPNFGIYARNADNNPTWIDSNLVPNPLAVQGKRVQFQEVDFPVKDGNQSTLTNLFINNDQEPSITYGLYPEGFPSTIAAQIKFQSSIGGYGGVQILSQLGESKSLTVNGMGVLATNVLAGSNSQYPLLVQVPDLDEWTVLGFSTLGGGFVGKCDIINTVTTNNGQLTIAAPNTATGISQRIMYLDSASSFVGINQSPSHTLDVGGDIGASGSLGVNEINVSTLINFQLADYLNRDLIQTTVAGTPNTILQVGVNLAPADRTLKFTVPGASSANMIMRNAGSNIGIGQFPADGVKLDVGGLIAGSNISTNAVFAETISTTNTVLNLVSYDNINLQADGSVIVGSPAGTANGQLNAGTVQADSGIFSNATISSITQPIQLDSIPHSTCVLTATQNWDYFVNSWGFYPGRQSVNGGYFITASNSIGAGHGYSEFIFPPPGLSSIQTFTGTYFTNSSNPGLNTPIWIGNATPGANGNVSTINVYGDLNADIMVSYIGYI